MMVVPLWANGFEEKEAETQAEKLVNIFRDENPGLEQYVFTFDPASLCPLYTNQEDHRELGCPKSLLTTLM